MVLCEDLAVDASMGLLTRRWNPRWGHRRCIYTVYPGVGRPLSISQDARSALHPCSRRQGRLPNCFDGIVRET